MPGSPQRPVQTPKFVHRFPILLLLFTAFAACSHPVQAGGQSSFRRTPILEVIGKQPTQPAPEVLARWDVSRLIPSGWAARGETKIRVVADADQPSALQIEAGNNSTLDIRDLPLLKTNRLRLKMRGGPCRVKVEFFTRTKSLGITRTVQLDSPTEFIQVDFDAAFLGRSGNSPDRVLIRVVGTHESLYLASLALLKVSPSGWLPEPGSTPWLSIGEDQRKATGLRSNTPLRVRFRGVGGARLEFNFGVPPEAVGEVDARLEVKLWPERGDPRETSYLISAQRGGMPWQAAHLDIPHALDGRQITATFRLVPKGLALAALALTPPQLVRAAERPSILLMTVDGFRADAVTTPGGAPLIEQAQRRELTRVLRTPSNSPRVAAGAILTGQSPTENGLLLDTDRLPTDANTLAGELSRAGYLTLALVGDPQLGHGSGLLEEFDWVFAPQEGADADALGAQAAVWLANLPPAPLFVWMHASDPLPPYDPKLRFVRRFSDQVGDKEFLPPEFRPAWNPDEEDARVVRVRYRAEISEVERQLARLIARGRLSTSIWAMAGLRGQGHGENGAWWRSDRMTPEILDVPIISMGVRGKQVLSGLDGGISSVGRALLDSAGLDNLEFPSGLGGNDLAFSADGSRISLRSEMGLGILALNKSQDGPAPRKKHGFHWIGSNRTPEELQAVHRDLLMRLENLQVDGLADCACEQCARADQQ